MKKFRHKVYAFLDPDVIETQGEKYFDLFIIILILLNIVALMVDTVKSIHTEYGAYLTAFEDLSILIFTVEYFLRLWSIVEDKKFRKPVSGRIRFALTPMALIDLCSFLPALLFLPFDLRFLRIVRIFRVIRLFKIIRYLKAVQVINQVIKSKRADLIVSFAFVLIMLIIVSFVMFYAEHIAQPDKFSSVPQTMWWAMETLTTVGYGDIYPITPLGQILGGLIAIIGIGLIAIPTGIIAAGYLEQISKKQHKGEVCPTCGQPIIHHE
ncbi:MAG TPA: ion transporter [Chitinophagales bacterium]|nr:ion transporter [Chitinophagales bacterium]